MKAAKHRRWNGSSLRGLLPLVCGGALLLTLAARDSKAFSWHHRCHDGSCCVSGNCAQPEELGGTWFWMRSPEEEQRVIMALYNRYCIRCHGVDGRGVWDIPGVPDFTNVVWQSCRSDNQSARSILEGRGAVMPPFRGTLTLEEACAMARYLRTFVPGTEVSRPDYGKQKSADEQAPEPRKAERSPE